MKRFWVGGVLALVCMFVAGISILQAAAPVATGKAISILTDRNYDASVNAKQVEQRNQVLDFMGPDLVRVLERRGGYKAQVINSRDEFKAADGTYLLVLRIKKYNPGSKGARMIVGFGAGATSLDIHYELVGTGKEPILDKDDGVGSSMEWMRCCRKLNENIMAAINAKLGETKTGK